MRQAGRISDWNDAKGFGFVTPNGGGERAFVHVKAFGHIGRRPSDGDAVSYVVVKDARGRSNAVEVRFNTGRAATARKAAEAGPGAPSSARAFIGVAFLVVVAAAAALHALLLPVAIAYGAMSVVAFAMYAKDKAAAATGAWRTPESTLHLLELLCGWPGALAAQGWLRHKNRKTSYQVEFWLVVVLNLASVSYGLWTGWLQRVSEDVMR